MANTVSILNYANTFGDWVVTTNALVQENNDLATGNYHKNSGTFFLDTSSLAFQSNGNAVFAQQLAVQGVGSSAYIQNNANIGGQLYLTNSVSSLLAFGPATFNGPNTGLTVANNALFSSNVQIVGDTTLSNNLIVAKNTTTNSLNTNTLNASGTSYTNILQANSSVNTASLSVVGNTYTNILQANSSVNTAILSVTGTSYTNILQANSSVNTSSLSVTGSGTVNTLQANSSVNTASLSVTGSGTVNTLQANSSVNTAILSVTGSGTVNTLQANSSVNTASLIVTGSGTVNTLQANSSVNTASLIVTGSGTVNTLQANSSVNTASLSVTGTSYTNILQANSNIFSPSISISSSVDGNNAVAIFKSIQTVGALTVGGNFVITGSTVYSSNYLTLSANSASPLISYLNVYRPAESANASIRWNEPNRYWDILDVNPGGSYSKILTANLISNSISSTNTATIPSSAIANTLNNSISSVNSALTSNVNILNSGIAAAYSRANTSANSFNGTSGVVTPTSGSVTLTSTNGITISGSGNTFTFNTPQDLRTTASPTFTNLAYTGTLTGGTGIVNIGSNQIYKDAAGNVGIGKVPSVLLDINGFVNAGNMQTGNGISTDPAFIELGGLRSGAGISYIDFHALAGTDNQTRVARNSGANGTFDLLNTGTGGIFLTQVGAGPIVFSVSNTEKARFDSSGNFGIGTTTPSTTLSVASVGGSQKRALFISSGNGTGSAGGVYITSATTSGGNGAVYEAIGQRSDSNGSAQFSGTTALGRLRTDASISTSGITLGRMTFGGNPTGTALSNILYSAQIAGVSDTAWSSSTAMGTALAFYTGATGIDINSVLGDAGTEAMRISSAGNLGIGNTAPGTKLDVTGVTRSTTFSVGASGGTAAFGAGTISSDANWGMYFRANTGAASAEFVFVNGAGTERMRISSTDGMMTINTTASPLLGISNVAGLSTITSRNNNANGIPGIGLTNGLAWTTAKNTGQIRFDGLTTGSTYTEYASIYSISDTNTATGAPTVLAFNTSNGSASATERMRIDSSGNVGIGTTAPTAKLHATSTSSTKYGLISQTPVVGLTAGNTVNMAYFQFKRFS